MRRKKSVIFLAALSLSALFVFSSLGAQDDSARFVSGTKINSVGVRRKRQKSGFRAFMQANISCQSEKRMVQRM